MRKTLSSVVTVVALLAASTSPAAAVDFGIFGSYWDSDDLGGAFGLASTRNVLAKFTPTSWPEIFTVQSSRSRPLKSGIQSSRSGSLVASGVQLSANAVAVAMTAGQHQWRILSGRAARMVG